MARRWSEEHVRPAVERRLAKTIGWLMGIGAVALLLAAAVVVLLINVADDRQSARQLSDRVAALQNKVQQHETVNQQRVLRADSAMAVAEAVSTQLVALSARLHEIASQQYAIEVRADRLDSAMTNVAAGLEELDESVQKDFNFVADRIDTALAVADAATTKATEAQQSVMQVRTGFEALRTDVNRRLDSQKWQNRLAVGLGVVNGAIIGIHAIPDSHHK